MKLVIDISEESYERIKYMYIHNNSTASDFKNIIEEGIPLDDVLDKIRAEITNIPITDSDGHINNWYREPQAVINDVLQIIDKYKAESEDKE